MMCFGLVAKSCLGTVWLEIVQKLVGQIDFFAKQGSAGIEQGCVRIKMHGHLGYGELIYPLLFIA